VFWSSGTAHVFFTGLVDCGGLALFQATPRGEAQIFTPHQHTGQSVPQSMESEALASHLALCQWCGIRRRRRKNKRSRFWYVVYDLPGTDFFPSTAFNPSIIMQRLVEVQIRLRKIPKHPVHTIARCEGLKACEALFPSKRSSRSYWPSGMPVLRACWRSSYFVQEAGLTLGLFAERET